ncbi:Slp family lipoprotein [Candidatus Nitrospira bockiana]
MRRPTRRSFLTLASALALCTALSLTAGCSRYEVIPDRLERHVNKSLSFEEIKTRPDAHRGELVVLGGEVLSAKRLSDKTRIEVLELPLTDELVPQADRTEASRGRFYAFDAGKDLIDPATLEKGTPVTIVGEVTGATTDRLDEAEYQYPTIRIKDLTKWEKRDARRWGYAYPYYGGYYWYGYRPFFYY